LEFITLNAVKTQPDIEKKLAEALSGEPAVATCYVFGSFLSPSFGRIFTE